MHDARRTLVRASFGSLLLCTILYLLVNLAYASTIPLPEFKRSIAVAALFASKVGGTAALRGVSLAVSISAWGVMLNVT